MLKECGEEKARGAFHPKCKNERRKGSSLPSLHFFSSLSFFFLCVFLSFGVVVANLFSSGVQANKVVVVFFCVREEENNNNMGLHSCKVLLFRFQMCVVDGL
jgi:hypothetical protein